MSDLLKKIISRGYWKITIRPKEFNSELITPISQCISIIKDNSLKLGGWDYPHFDLNIKPLIATDYIEQSTDWWDHLEYWRYYQSGQFIHYCGLGEDWQEQRTEWPQWIDSKPGESLAIFETLFMITQIFEFSARLAIKNILGSECFLKIELHNINNRKLFMDRRNRMLSYDYKCIVNELIRTFELTAADLISNSSQYSIEHTIWLLNRFNWTGISPIIFTDEQKKFIQGM